MAIGCLHSNSMAVTHYIVNCYALHTEKVFLIHTVSVSLVLRVLIQMMVCLHFIDAKTQFEFEEFNKRCMFCWFCVALWLVCVVLQEQPIVS